MKKPRDKGLGVFAEAWQNMMADFDKHLPQKLRGAKGKLKFTLGLALIELLILAGIGTAVYDWLKG